LKIYHLIDNSDQINFGIYNAALEPTIFSNHEHYAWAQLGAPINSFSHYKIQLVNDVSLADLGPENSIIVSHGCWMQPSKILLRASKRRIKTIYTPQGMLEPWSLANKKFKKIIYYQLFEKQYAKSATLIRGVSKPETERLKIKFPNSRVIHIPNGAKIQNSIKTFNKPFKVVFLSRLHHKKGLLPLVQAWNKWSPDPDDWQLKIAGPDEGELEKIRPFLGESIDYLGPQFGSDKNKLLASAHFFALPSHSEGFPTSVVEGIGHGLIPLISHGCNFPEVFEQKCGWNIEPTIDQILNTFMHIQEVTIDALQEKSNRSLSLAKNYDLKVISQELDKLYEKLSDEN